MFRRSTLIPTSSWSDECLRLNWTDIKKPEDLKITLASLFEDVQTTLSKVLLEHYLHSAFLERMDRLTLTRTGVAADEWRVNFYLYDEYPAGETPRDQVFPGSRIKGIRIVDLSLSFQGESSSSRMVDLATRSAPGVRDSTKAYDLHPLMPQCEKVIFQLHQWLADAMCLAASDPHYLRKLPDHSDDQRVTEYVIGLSLADPKKVHLPLFL